MSSVEPLRVRAASARAPGAARGGTAWDEVRPANAEDGAPDLDDDPHAREVVEAVRRLLVTEAGVRDEEIVNSRWVRQATKHHPDFATRHAWHFDYGQHSGGIFSAIIYTGNDGDEPLVGGYTGFANTPPPEEDATAVSSAGVERLANGSALLHRGLVVAPRVGRLVLFSGGSENYHAPLPVASGRRQTLQAWYRCRC